MCIHSGMPFISMWVWKRKLLHRAGARDCFITWPMCALSSAFQVFLATMYPRQSTWGRDNFFIFSIQASSKFVITQSPKKAHKVHRIPMLWAFSTRNFLLRHNFLLKLVSLIIRLQCPLVTTWTNCNFAISDYLIVPYFRRCFPFPDVPLNFSCHGNNPLYIGCIDIIMRCSIFREYYIHALSMFRQARNHNRG